MTEESQNSTDGRERVFAVRMTSWSSRLARAAGVVGAVSVLVLMLHVVADTALRFTVNSPLAGTLEYVANWWMVLIVWGGLAITALRGEHIAADLVYERMPKRTQVRWNVFTQLLTAVFVGIVAWYGLENALHHAETGEVVGSTEVPIWPMRFAVPVGAILYGIVCLHSIMGRRSEPEGEAVEEQTP